MKKFILLTVGFEKPTPEIMQAWNEWFSSIGDKIIEQVGLMNGREVKTTGTTSIEMGKDAITGYLVIQAADIEEATKIAEKCPMITSTLVYEAMSHNA